MSPRSFPTTPVAPQIRSPSFITPSYFLIFTLEIALVLLYFINSVAEQQLTAEYFFQFPRQLSQFLFSNSIIPPFSTGTNSVAQMIKLVESRRCFLPVCVERKREKNHHRHRSALWTFFHPACRSLNILTFRQAVVSCGSREEIFKTRGEGKFGTKWIFSRILSVDDWWQQFLLRWKPMIVIEISASRSLLSGIGEKVENLNQPREQ